MNLETYIKNLLYRYDCVIVPDFGGFVTKRISAKVNEATHQFFPPSKQLSFNRNLNNNDGLLANYIASVENISFEKASNAIALSVIKWQNEIQTKPIVLETIGILRLNENRQIIFEPTTYVNFLSESFGLHSFESSAIKRYKQEVKNIIPEVTNKDKKGFPIFIKYAASAAILVALGISLYSNNETTVQKEVFAKQQKALEKKIQTATFVISNPLPTIDLTVAQELPKQFHVVAGAFQIPENAERKVAQLKAEGHDASIIGMNKWGLTQVVFASFSDKNDATNYLYKIQNSTSKDAWLLIKN
ncbi:SPOR domain-containing protein [Polaribacter sp. BAL334]|uniref:HU domain-containing protein n=1 Tax=Polaribacter sp. BAL334 TaxID=1708178 RepID=UPI0018D2680B|nr:SPOR domain-containing protein [Polaribacter sp. BAL334]MBG7611539.1 SPOR domain-containing protein [Polaribacter sp. BAL334]